MIFDDAQTTTIAPWIPRIGDGDVLITSIDSTFSVGGGDTLSVTAMQPDEAVQLLTTRLELNTEQIGVRVDLVRRLTEALEYWPLALELAASYLRSCGYSITDIPYYLDSLKVRSLADQHSIPQGYPRTLVAAIDLAIEILNDSEADIIAEISSEMLIRACYLANRRIPIHLLAAASDPNLDTLPSNSGPAIIEDPLVLEAVRALRRISFARSDQPLPRRETDIATSDYTIAVNGVLQEVLRTRIEMNHQLTEWQSQMERLASHLNVWLSSATYNGEADKAHSLVPHGVVLTGHLLRLNVTSSKVALLIGNLAGVYSGAKRSEVAVELLNTELQMIMGTNEPDEFLVHQTRLHLASALVAGDSISTASATQAVDNLEYAVAYCQRLALDADTHLAASTFCVQSIFILEKIARTGLHAPRVPQLENVFTETLGRLPPTDLSDALDTIRLVTSHISDERYSDAEQACRYFLMRDLYGSNVQLEVHRLLIESLLYQLNWASGKIEIDSFAAKVGHNPLYRDTVDMALHNIGLLLAGYSLLHLIEPKDLFAHIMSLPCFIEAVSNAQGEYRVKFDILSLILAVTQKTRRDVEFYSVKVRETALEDVHITGNRGWAILAKTALGTAQLMLEPALVETPDPSSSA